jgi:hypothetical protein
MSKNNNYHITKHPDGGWQYKRENAQRAAGITRTQKEAELAAKEILRNHGGGEVRIHTPKGPIRDSDTVAPANDPCPPKDKKY